MLQKIKFLFPVTNPESQSFFSTLKEMLQEVPNTNETTDQIIIQPINPSHASPQIVIEKSSTTTIGVQFDSNSPVDQEINTIITNVLSKSIKKTYEDPSLSNVYKKLKGHIQRVDHTGINVPSTLLAKEKWHELIRKIAGVSAIYTYPTEENWLFIIPSTTSEFITDITNFSTTREPKFELVYDEVDTIPTLQFDIETDFTQKEVEMLFPDPIGKSLEGLESFFRTIYIDSPYAHVYIRFDIRFKNVSDQEWYTGEWLVKEGKRIM